MNEKATTKDPIQASFGWSPLLPIEVNCRLSSGLAAAEQVSSSEHPQQLQDKGSLATIAFLI